MSDGAVLFWYDSIMGVSEHVAMRAVDLVEARLVRTIPVSLKDNHPYPGALVIGKEDDYSVWFTPEGVICTCANGADHAPGLPKCSHSIAAMLAWEAESNG